MPEKRKYQRFTVLYPAQYCMTEQKLRFSRECTIKNLSMNGILLESTKQIKKDTTLWVYLDLSDNTYKLPGKVIRAEVSEKPKHYYLAIALEKVTPKFRERLQEEIPVIDEYLRWKQKHQAQIKPEKLLG